MSSNQHELKTFDFHKLLSWSVVCLVCWYIVLCIFHYFNQRPLWNDEECVFRSIKAFSTWQIFHEPLMAVQVFPRLYLFLIQKISQLFSYHLLSLRFLSFISMVSAFFIWLRLAQYEIKNKLEYLTFVLSWAASGLLIYYSAELKQYSMDVLTGALFLLFIYNQKRLQEKEKIKLYVILLIILPIMGLFSYTAFLFMGFPLYNLILYSKSNHNYLKFLIIYLTSLICIMGISYFFDIRLRPLKVVTVGFEEATAQSFQCLHRPNGHIFRKHPEDVL